MAQARLLAHSSSIGPLDWPILGSGSIGGRVYPSRTRIFVKTKMSDSSGAHGSHVVSGAGERVKVHANVQLEDDRGNFQDSTEIFYSPALRCSHGVDLPTAGQ